MAEKTYTLTMTPQEAQLVAWALAQHSNEKRSRLSMYEVPDQPRGTDTCCEAHWQQYLRNKSQYDALVEQYESVRALSLRTSTLVDDENSSPTDSPVLNALHQAPLERGDATAAAKLVADPDQSWASHIGPLLDELS